ncbi:DUF4132 domain-containing protein [Chitinophaga sp. Cy-1792]|uniref:DUF4132 domain-containing protein n=1 Tax=Chitinophaga sp. Cy-1792 TaxID=2608339 RepID=UPI0014221CFB|nr:DUF4132 domain-containing protein [Chitinophaga sp. Cy-1792]NIG54467.1 DUF4132 domain-containing protein [Chitinophaga sp. Cy-1792]
MRTIDDFPLPAGEDWEDLFTLFLSLDNHKKRPDKEWYAKVKVVLDKIGHEQYLDVTVNWLIAKCEQLQRNIKRLDEFLKKSWRFRLHEDFPLTQRMEKVLENQRPAWVDVVLGTEYYYTKENPLYLRDGYYYFYTLGGRIIRGTLHTNMILENEVLYDMMDVLMRLAPEVTMDILHIYRNRDAAFAVPRLMIVRDAIRHKTYRRAVDTAIAKFGDKTNKTSGAEAMKERFIPDMDFNNRHQLLVKDGSYAMGIDLMLAGPEIVLLENGVPAIKVPAAVKKELTERFKVFQKKHKEISAHYTLQKNRLEEIYRHNREWLYENWEPYYITHPFVGALGKQLIWEFVNGDQSTTAICRKGTFVNSVGEEVNWVEEPDTIVRLWHPAKATAAEIADWRNYCIQHKLKQPFRQAFREVYRLNDNHNNWSVDHFEGHVVKQRQYNALCKMRGWSTGDFRHEHTNIKLPAYKLTAYLCIADVWYDSLSNGDHLQVTGGVDFEGKGYSGNMEDIPPVILSEVLRDVDMIVSVSSIGNENKPVTEVMEKARTYYEDYTKRSLSPIGIVRRDILQLLLPHMVYSDRFRIDDQYVHVTGTLANYNIHIATGQATNVATGLGVHIAPSFSRNAGLFLPDEGDIMLTVILSKANFLAEDDLIADEHLLQRIKYTSHRS